MAVNFGIIGAGNIAATMASTLMQMPEAEGYAIASRDKVKAQKFKEKYKMSVAYDSYEQLYNDKNVDIVYIATPHSFHFEHAQLCLRSGKNVLCEKPFTVNAEQAERLFSLAEERGLFICEAMWTRFMPLANKLKSIIDDNVIGEITSMSANLNFPMMQNERLINPELAGGALLDVGIYPLTIASIVMGDEIESISSAAVLTENGVDKIGQYTLKYTDGKIADLNAGMCSYSDGNAVIYGTKGFIVVDGVNCLNKIQVFDSSWNKSSEYIKEKQITGYEYEVRACVRSLEKGCRECSEMTHMQTLKMIRQMDMIRQKIGVKYPFE